MKRHFDPHIVGSLLVCSMLALVVGGILVFSDKANDANAGTTFVANTPPMADGQYTGWKSAPGNQGWSVIDDGACNGTDFVSSVSDGNENPNARLESYIVNLNSIPNSSSTTSVIVKKIELIPCMAASMDARTYAGTKSKQPYAPAVADVFWIYNDPSQGILSQGDFKGAYQLSSKTYKQMATSTWSGLDYLKTEWTQVQVGVRYSDGNAGVKMGKLQALITYEVYNQQ